MPRTRFRLGTRASGLARAQSGIVRARLAALHPGAEFEEVLVTTDGDRDTVTPLQRIGGEGVFTSALERALRATEIDFAVHSLKDLPIAGEDDLVVAAIGLRDDARDALVARNGWTLATLPRGARVGTCSTRRSAQLRAMRPDLTLLPVRGNVDTRVRHVADGRFDAIVLAAAGLHRLGLHAHITQYLSFDEMLPAPGQGALAVQCRANDARTRALVATLDDIDVRDATDAERGVLEAFGGGCAAPVAAYAEVCGATLHVRAAVAPDEHSAVVRLEHRGARDAGGRAVGRALATGAAGRTGQ